MSSSQAEISNFLFYLDDFVRGFGDRQLYYTIMEVVGAPHICHALTLLHQDLQLVVAPTIREANVLIVHNNSEEDMRYFAYLLSEYELVHIVEARWLGHCDDHNEIVPFGTHDLTDAALAAIDAEYAAAEAEAEAAMSTDEDTNEGTDDDTDTYVLIEEGPGASA